MAMTVRDWACGFSPGWLDLSIVKGFVVDKDLLSLAFEKDSARVETSGH